jgi:rhomboid protease GluP
VQHNELIRAGQWWRLITPTALHGNFVHLAVNTSSLNSLGAVMEGLSCRPRFLTVYAVSGIAGNLASFALCPIPSVGASGDALHCVQVLIHTDLGQCLH